MVWRRGDARRRRTGAAPLLAVLTVSCTGSDFYPTEPPPSAYRGLDPGVKGLHRLNSAEYNATVQDVLGTKLEPATATWRGGQDVEFDNIAAVLGVDDELYGHYLAAAKELSADVMGSEAGRARFVTCELAAPGCFRTCLASAGLRLFRRPLTDAELVSYTKVYESALALGDLPSAAFELVLRALLSSLQFVYRIEKDEPGAAGRVRALDPFELASRLSYFLWSSAPDDALLQAAADGTLEEEAALIATVDRMLADPKGERFVERFAGQWLGAQKVISHPTSSIDWSPEVAAAASKEVLLYFGELVATDRSWLDFLKADVNFVNEPLAHLYGMGNPGVPLARVEQVEDGRAGFLGLAGFLAVSSYDRRTSPSLRGRWISSNLLCAEPPPPPSSVPPLAAAGGAMEPSNIRQSLEQHRQNPACAACHAVFDPYGLALEEFDAIGQRRSVYPDGSPIDASVTLPASAQHPQGVTFTGLGGVSDVVTADPRFTACIAKKLMTYGLGRAVSAQDEPVLSAVLEKWRAPGAVPSVRRLIHELVRSDAFRFRRAEGAP